MNSDHINTVWFLLCIELLSITVSFSQTVQQEKCCVQIEDKLEYTTDKNDSLTPVNQLLTGLRYYATGTHQLVVGDTFSINKSTVCRTVHKVTRAIVSLRPKYVKFPTTTEERRDVVNLFFMRSRLPGVIGSIDCVHIPIQSPGGDDAEIYRNRKCYFSINVQLVCDTTNYIII